MPNNVEKDRGAIRPTLFIGLGGTGKEVLLRLRRRFYERFGDSKLPCVAYLWLDTDTLDHMAQGEPMDEIYRAVAFDDLERIPLLQGQVGTHLGDVLLNKGRYEHIHRWLYSEIERYGSEIGDGAGGVRAVGRLTFFAKYKSIADRIKGLLDDLATQEKIKKTNALIEAEVVSKRQVFLIASVAGGTGCGTLLDTVFLMRKLQKEVSIERLVGILFLPNVYYTTTTDPRARRSYGNAYAALKELEFYTLRRRDFVEGSMQDDIGLGINFEVEWEKGQPAEILGPPFSVTYILERQNEGEIGLETRAELFHMVAESLFLDFMPGAFSTAKRSHYSNVTEDLSSEKGANVSHGGMVFSQSFASRYASFGMSKIEVPIERLKGACAAQLACDIVEYWGRETDNPQVRTHVLEEMAQREFHVDGLVQRFGEGWQDTIKDRIQKVFRGVSIKETRQLDDLVSKIEEVEYDILRDDPTKWGTAIESIRGSRNKVLVKLRQDLLQWIREGLENPAPGLKGLLKDNGYLRHLTETLKESYSSDGEGRMPEFEVRKEAAQRDSESWREEKEKNQRELKIALKSPGVAALALRGQVVDKLIDRLKDAEQQFALAKAELCLLEEAKALAKSAVDFLGEKKAELQKFMTPLDGMAGRFRRKKEGYLNFGEGVLFMRFFKEKDDWPRFYALGISKDRHHLPVNPQKEHRGFLNEVSGANKTLWDLVESFGKERERGIESKLTRFCEKRFTKDFDDCPRDINVLDHLKGRENEITKELVRCALPMVNCDDRWVGQPVKQAYLGIAAKDVEPYTTFIPLIEEQLKAQGYHQIDPQPTGKPWEVYLYLVSYALPLPSLRLVTNQCHTAYYDFYKALRAGQVGQQEHRIPLHLSKQWEGKFDDLLVYSDEDAKQIKEALDVLLFGSILRVLDVRVIDGRLEYGYKKWIPPASRLEALGTRREAIEMLREDGMFRGSLLKTVKEREEGLKDQLESYYWLLSYLSLGEEFPPKTPERILLEDTLFPIHERLAKDKDEAELSLEHLPQQEQAKEAKARLGDNAEWIGTFPVLKGLEAWVSR